MSAPHDSILHELVCECGMCTATHVADPAALPRGPHGFISQRVCQFWCGEPSKRAPGVLAVRIPALGVAGHHTAITMAAHLLPFPWPHVQFCGSCIVRGHVRTNLIHCLGL